MREDYEFYSPDPYEIPSAEEINNDMIVIPPASAVEHLFRKMSRYRTAPDDVIARRVREWCAVAHAIQRDFGKKSPTA